MTDLELRVGYETDRKTTPVIGNKVVLPSAEGRLGTSRLRYSFIDVDNAVIPRNGAVREVKTESPVKTNERFAFAASTFGPGPGDFLLDSIERRARSYLSKQLAAPLIKG